MIEKVILDYLSNVLAVPVYMEVPKNSTEQYVLIEKVSSARKNYIDSALITIQSIAKSLYDAAQLNEQVKNAMDRIAFFTDSSAKLNSDYNYTDTSKKQYRYQAVYNVFY